MGGWLTIRCSPSTVSASFDRACKLSRVRAFAASFSASFSLFFAIFFFALLACALSAFFMAARSSASDRRAYQMSMVDISANSAIAVR